MRLSEKETPTKRRAYVDEIYNLCERVEEALGSLYKAFLYHRPEFLQEAELNIQAIRGRYEKLTEQLLQASETDRVAMRYAPVPVNLERIAHNLEHISRAIGTKIRENLLFSDKAVGELNYLFYRLKEVLAALEDMVVARNTFLANYIKESEREIERAASEYATAHEDRLIEGICLPKSSGIYLVILDSLKRIAWNAKDIAENLSKE